MPGPYFPTIVAHRGLHHGYPENSRGAFRAARAAGVGWVECDVWASADGEPVVIHDQTLDRTSTDRGPVGDRDARSLGAIRLLGPSGAPHWCHVPLLRDLIVPSRDAAPLPPPTAEAGLLVEIKPPDAADLVRSVVELLRGSAQGWQIQSFHESNLLHARAIDPRLPVACLVEDRPALEHAIAAGWKDVHLRHDLLDRPTADRLRDRGVRIGVWTPNTWDDLMRVMDLRADVIITDEPVQAAGMVRRLNSPG